MRVRSAWLRLWSRCYDKLGNAGEEDAYCFWVKKNVAEF